MGKPQLIRLRLDDFEGWPRQAAIILRSDRGHVGVFVQWYFSHPGRPASITVQLIPNYARSFFGQREAVVFPTPASASITSATSQAQTSGSSSGSSGGSTATPGASTSSLPEGKRPASSSA